MISEVLRRNMDSKERLSLPAVENRLTFYFSLSGWGRAQVLFIKV